MLKFSKTLRLIVSAAAIAVAVSAPVSAQQRERNYTMADKTSEELGKLQPLLAAKNHAGALAVLDAQAARVEPNSYDMAVIQQVKAQVLLQNNQFAEAIAPLERCLMLSDAATPTYFEDRVTLEFSYYLAQLYYQEATTAKNPQLVIQYFDKAEKYMARWTSRTKKPTPEAFLFYASLLYNRAVADSENTDANRIKRALQLVDEALRFNTRPKDNLYVLKLACQLQLADNKNAAETLEFLVRIKPDNRTYWQQLAAIYLSLGQDVRAITAIERAQTNGFMNTPKDNFNLIGIYFNIGQFEKAAELLEKGLRDGSVDNEQKNWELLSFSYQQLRRERKSIDALARATKQFPEAGQLEYMVAQAHYSLDESEKALERAELALKKGNLTKRHSVLLFAAYIAFELKKFEQSLEFVNEALTLPDGAEEGKRMKTAIEDAIAAREARLNKM